MTKGNIISDHSGLTLIELMIVMILSLFLMMTVYLAYQVQHKSSRSQELALTVEQDARAIMDLMERDIRNAGCDPKDPPLNLIGITSTSGYGFGAGNTNAVLGLVADLDGNGDTAGADETVEYTWNSLTNVLKRNNQVLSNNVIILALTYTTMDSAGNVVNLTPTAGNQLDANVSRVKTIGIRLKLRSNNVDPDTGQYQFSEFNRQAEGRNLGL